MIHTLAYDGSYMVIGKGIIYGFALSAAFDKLAVFKNSQLMGYG